MPDLSFIYRTVNEHGYRTFHFGKEMVAYWNWCPTMQWRGLALMKKAERTFTGSDTKAAS